MTFQELTTLPVTLVEQASAQALQRVQELHPDLDLQSGVLSKFVIELNGILAAAIDNVLAGYLSARSLLDITNSPTTADTETTDRILSNFGVSRTAGTNAYGDIAVVVTGASTRTIAAGPVFSRDDLLFYVDKPYTASLEGDPSINPSSRKLIDIGDGRYRFTVPVVADGVGSIYRLSRGTAVVPLVVPYGFVSAFAAADFQGGVDAESNDQLLQRLQIGISAKAVSNRANILASVYAQPLFAGIVRASVIGFGDPEMTRDRPSVLGISAGGSMDVYVRSEARAIRKTQSRTARLLSVAGNVGTWETQFTAAENAGVYRVDAFQKPNAGLTSGGYPVSLIARWITPPAEGFYPRLASEEQAAFGSYLATRFQFQVPTIEVPGTVGDTKLFDCVTVSLPLVAELQAYFNGRSVRSYGADIHVLAAVPFFVKIAMEIETQSTDSIDANAIKESVCAVVNSIGFTGRLHASVIASAVHANLPSGAGVSSMSLLGELVEPSGLVHARYSSTMLDIPSNVGPAVTQNTVQFFCSPEDVGVTLRPTITTPA